MATVKENSEPSLPDHGGDYGFVERVTIYLSTGLKVDRTDCIVESGTFVSIFTSLQMQSTNPESLSPSGSLT